LLAAIALTRTFSSTSRRPSPLDLLDERFARGEIDADEYRQRQDALRR
jgi:putative membrane protein